MQVSRIAAQEARFSDVVRNVKDVLRRRYLVLAGVTAICVLAGTAATFMITPRYQGVARLQIDPNQNPLAQKRNDTQAQLVTEAIETQVSVFSSLDLARNVVRRLDLEHDPEFAKALAGAQKNRSFSADEKIDFLAARLVSGLSVNRDKLTYVILVKYMSEDAAKAARIANEYAAAYIDWRVNNNIGTAQKQTQFFQTQLDQMAADARAADEKVAQVEAQSGITSKSDVVGSITDQQIGPLSVQMASAESIAAEARSKASSARQLVAQGKLDTVSDVHRSQTIIDLKKDRAALVQNLADMRQRYGEAHPDLLKVREQIAAIDNQLAIEARRIVASLDSDAAAAEAQASNLRQAMGRLEDKKAQEARAAVQLQSLEREAVGKHEAYDRMAQMTTDARQATQASFAQAQIIDAARVPHAPASPNKPLIIALSLILGVGLGLVVITIQEMLVSGMSSVQAIEEELGQPLIAAVPLVSSHARPADLLIEKPTSQFAEALRNARATIIGVRAETRPRIIAMTSALPNEGKTTTAVGLARTMALSGDRTIIVDADVRRAQMSKSLGVQPNSVGLVEVLSGEASLDDAIFSTGMNGLDALSVSKPYFTSENLFGSGNFHDLLDQLSARYDTILLDLPPLVGLADGRFIAALADAVVLAGKWNATPMSAVKSALGWLQNDSANLVGVMYTMVEPNSAAYGSYYYYSSAYTAYYHDTQQQEPVRA